MLPSAIKTSKNNTLAHLNQVVCSYHLQNHAFVSEQTWSTLYLYRGHILRSAALLGLLSSVEVSNWNRGKTCARLLNSMNSHFIDLPQVPITVSEEAALEEAAVDGITGALIRLRGYCDPEELKAVQELLDKYSNLGNAIKSAT